MHGGFSTRGLHQGANVALAQLHKCTALQAAWQHHCAVANTNQAAHGVADGLEHAAHFAVTAFRNSDAVPTVGTFATALFDRAKLGWTVVELNAGDELLFLIFAELAQRTHRVFALQTKAGVHQLVGQFARAGEQQQTFGVQVQTADRLPFTLVQAWQATEYGGTVLRVVSGHHFARRLVIRNHARRRRCNAHFDGAAIDLNLVSKLHALAGVSHFVVDGHMAFGNEALHLDARAHARLGQDFVQLGRFGLRQQHALFGRSFGTDEFCVELARDDVFKIKSRVVVQQLVVCFVGFFGFGWLATQVVVVSVHSVHRRLGRGLWVRKVQK